MSTYEVNGKKVSREEAVDFLNRASKITHFSVTKNRESEKGELSHEGFEIEKSLISSMSKGMDEYEAGYLRVSFLDSSKIMGRDLYIVMMDPGAVPKWKRWAVRLLEKLI